MKVHVLNRNSSIYTCRAYLVLGDWNTLEDVNTLVDTGTDDSLLEEIATIYTGVGKKAVQQVVLTHNHFDHTGGLTEVIRRWQPAVLAHSNRPAGTVQLRDGQRLRLGDRQFEVMHVPGHTSDSICLYCEEEGALFSGDTPVRILTPGGVYVRPYAEFLAKLARRHLQVIYPGHSDPVTENVPAMIRHTLSNVKASKVVDTADISGNG